MSGASRTVAAVFLAAIAALALTATQAAAEEARLSPEDQADVARIEAYLNDISTVEARFVQISPRGGVSEGVLYISRPGKLRVEYDAPNPILLVATGVWLIYHDSELGQTTYLPLSSSPAAFLIDADLTLSGKTTVRRVDRGPGVIRATLVETDSEEKGSLVLTFSDRPLVLRQWTVIDPQGQATQVALLNARFGLDLDPVLFLFAAGGGETDEEF